MDLERVIEVLEAEWSDREGFLGGLREGVFDSSGFVRFHQFLSSIEIDKSRPLDRRFVALTWYVPIFMSWQRERVQERNGSVEELDKATTKILNILEQVLGVP